MAHLHILFVVTSTGRVFQMGDKITLHPNTTTLYVVTGITSGLKGIRVTVTRDCPAQATTFKPETVFIDVSDYSYIGCSRAKED